MEYVIDNKVYEVVIIKKRNKNTYIRVKEDMKIYVTTNYLVSKRYVKITNGHLIYYKIKLT